MKRLIAVCAAIMLTLPAGMCVSTRYVKISCVTPEQFEKLKADAPPKVKEKLTGNAAEDIKIIAGSNVRLRGYADGLLGVLGGCVSDTHP